MATAYLDIWPNLQFYFSVFYLVLISIKKLYQTLETALNQISNTSKFVKNTPLRVVFSTLFSVFGNVVKHSLASFDILLNPDSKELTGFQANRDRRSRTAEAVTKNISSES